MQLRGNSHIGRRVEVRDLWSGMLSLLLLLLIFSVGSETFAQDADALQALANVLHSSNTLAQKVSELMQT